MVRKSVSLGKFGGLGRLVSPVRVGGSVKVRKVSKSAKLEKSQ